MFDLEYVGDRHEISRGPSGSYGRRDEVRYK